MRNLKMYALLALGVPSKYSNGWSVPFNSHTAVQKCVTRNFLFSPQSNKVYNSQLSAAGCKDSEKLANIETKDEYGNTPLMLAMLHKDSDLFKEIIYASNFNLTKFHYGKISDGKDKIASHPNVIFEYAVRHNMNDIVDKMVEKNLVDINSLNEFGEKPIFALVSKHRNDLVKKFLDERDLVLKNAYGDTLFQWALKSRNVNFIAVKHLLNMADDCKFDNIFLHMLKDAFRTRGFPENLSRWEIKDRKRSEFLYCAIEFGSRDITEKILKKINYKLTQKDMETYYSLTNGNIFSVIWDNIGADTVKKIIKNGYDINSRNLRGEPLLYRLITGAESVGSYDFAKYLINEGVDLFFVTDSGSTLLDAVVSQISEKNLYKPLLETINSKLLEYLDSSSKAKIESILNQYQDTGDEYYKFLSLNCDKIIEKYIEEQKENKDYIKSFDKLTKILQNIIDTRDWVLKEKLLKAFLNILYENKSDNIKYNYEKSIIEKDIPNGLEGISVLLTKVLFRNENISVNQESVSANKEKPNYVERVLVGLARGLFRNENNSGNKENTDCLVREVKKARIKNCKKATNEEIFDEAISRLAARDVRRNGHDVRKVLDSIYKILDSFDKLPGVSADLLANIVSISNTSKELVRNLYNLENMLMNFKRSEVVSFLTRDAMENFEDIYEKSMRKILNIPDSIEGSFGEFYHKFRNPSALATYFGKINNLPNVKKVLIEDFVYPSLKGDFYKKLYHETDEYNKKNSHFDIVFKDRPKLLKKWKEGASIEINEKIPSGAIKPFTITQTKDPFDMFMLGTETSSCQRVDGDPGYNKCLMAYVLNPCTQAILIKSHDDGKIVARSIIRMLWDEKKEQPILLLERPYLNNGLAPIGSASSIKHYAIKRAEEMELPLVSKYYNVYSKDKYESKIVSYDSGKAPYEYSDAVRGVTNGRYTIKDGVCLYKPPFEPKRDSLKNKMDKTF